MHIHPTFKKNISPWITYPILTMFSFVLVFSGFFLYARHTTAQNIGLPGFGGTIGFVQLNCLCNLGVMITVIPSPADAAQGKVAQNLMFYYAGQVLEIAGVDFPIPPPRVYMWYQIFYAGGQQILGNYFPATVPCLAYVGGACVPAGTATGIIYNVGTSLFPV